MRSLICALRNRVRSRRRRIVRRRHEARAHQPVRDQLADPLRVLHIRFPAGDIAKVLSVQEPALEPILQYAEHRLPVHAGRLHPHQRHRERRQPLAQLGQSPDRRAERPRAQLEAAAILARDPDRRHDVVTVHIKTSAPLDHFIHPLPPSETINSSPRPEGASLDESDLRAQGSSQRPTGPRAILLDGLGRTKQRRRQSGQRPTPGFSRRTGGRARTARVTLGRLRARAGSTVLSLVPRVTASRSLRMVIAPTRSPLVAYTPGMSPRASIRARRRRSCPLRQARMSTSCWSPCGATVSRAQPVSSPRSGPTRWCCLWATTRPDVRVFLAGRALGSRSAFPVLAGRSAPVWPPTTRSPSMACLSTRALASPGE